MYVKKNIECMYVHKKKNTYTLRITLSFTRSGLKLVEMFFFFFGIDFTDPPDIFFCCCEFKEITGLRKPTSVLCHAK
eukprot:NODE_1059_length_618_cov_12.713533_g987_i0.p1 GENE.NODE_1059_length_618_cov_12.713533_g987_i0~~NODE_1059_length_618_cov_12.713533_g987_i0.p1  ORF type:complete len:77 (-),score=11.61 NODE_1059_length_618_cov_12.713533_g987_i0:281-511(-)